MVALKKKDTNLTIDQSLPLIKKLDMLRYLVNSLRVAGSYFFSGEYHLKAIAGPLCVTRGYDPQDFLKIIIGKYECRIICSSDDITSETVVRDIFDNEKKVVVRKGGVNIAQKRLHKHYQELMANYRHPLLMKICNLYLSPIEQLAAINYLKAKD